MSFFPIVLIALALCMVLFLLWLRECVETHVINLFLAKAKNFILHMVSPFPTKLPWNFAGAPTCKSYSLHKKRTICMVLFFIMVAGVGFEPTTFGLWARRASGLLYPATFCLKRLYNTTKKLICQHFLYKNIVFSFFKVYAF